MSDPPCIVNTIRKLIKVINEKGQKMTNRIWESRNDYQNDAQRLGYVTCSAGCGRVTAWSLCVMCGGNYAEHNLLGKAVI
jgi:uncharacterized Fe-S cluster-containing MiaB family protein